MAISRSCSAASEAWCRSLHDPGRDLLVALPGGVLNDDAALAGVGLGGGHAHALVVVDLFDGHRGALGGDVIEAGLGRTLGMCTTAFWPSLLAAHATPRPWLPSVAVKKVAWPKSLAS